LIIKNDVIIVGSSYRNEKSKKAVDV